MGMHHNDERDAEELSSTSGAMHIVEKMQRRLATQMQVQCFVRYHKDTAKDTHRLCRGAA